VTHRTFLKFEDGAFEVKATFAEAASDESRQTSKIIPPLISNIG